ncbi:MAG: acetylornithine deacetylase [Hyphomonadaceae bacterium]|nr:acetylornithine deacetylase [Hyphomonadaceae bacterium]
MTSLAAVRDVLARLVAFDTTSRDTNLPLIEWVEDFLAPMGAHLVRVPSEDGTKANLWARFGPDVPGGIVLSGHTDVVPIDGQPWTTNPWDLIQRDGKFFARGTTDMKGFLALALAHAEAISKIPLKKPVHFALSYDEEVGCAGVAPMIEEIGRRGAAPEVVWVGEPTMWGVMSAHKGIRDYEVKITGKAAHSSDPRMGASAIHEAVELLTIIRRIAREQEENAPKNSDFDPSWTTLTIGELNGGTASNILARECRFVFDVRSVPGVNPDQMLKPFFAEVERMRARLEPLGPECGVEINMRADAPPLQVVRDSPAERFMRSLTGDNAIHVAAYATEAGQFQRAGFPSVICGPGSVEQAHQPDEFVAISELERGLEVFRRFLETLRA